jgi:hypothetical protein
VSPLRLTAILALLVAPFLATAACSGPPGCHANATVHVQGRIRTASGDGVRTAASVCAESTWCDPTNWAEPTDCQQPSRRDDCVAIQSAADGTYAAYVILNPDDSWPDLRMQSIEWTLMPAGEPTYAATPIASASAVPLTDCERATVDFTLAP